MTVSVSISASGTVAEDKAEELRAKFSTFTSALSDAGVTGTCAFNASEPALESAPPPSTEAP